jgi:hypothetical protein
MNQEITRMFQTKVNAIRDTIRNSLDAMALGQ